jgi:hypothetical protein
MSQWVACLWTSGQRSYGRGFDSVLWTFLWGVYSLSTMAVLIAWPMYYFLKLLFKRLGLHGVLRSFVITK